MPPSGAAALMSPEMTPFTSVCVCVCVCALITTVVFDDEFVFVLCVFTMTMQVGLLGTAASSVLRKHYKSFL